VIDGFGLDELLKLEKGGQESANPQSDATLEFHPHQRDAPAARRLLAFDVHVQMWIHEWRAEGGMGRHCGVNVQPRPPLSCHLVIRGYTRRDAPRTRIMDPNLQRPQRPSRNLGVSCTLSKLAAQDRRDLVASSLPPPAAAKFAFVHAATTHNTKGGGALCDTLTDWTIARWRYATVSL